MGFNFNFSSLDFSGINPFEAKDNTGFSFGEKEFVSRAKLNHSPVVYENALEMAGQMDINKDYFAIVSGKFIYGDFLEAICDVHHLEPKMMIVSTLGMGKNNVDSLVNIVDYLGCQRMGLVVSNYFYGVERNGVIPYMVQEFTGRPIAVAVCASHSKIAMIDCKAGKLTIFGSANLSSSNNLEEFTIVHDPAIYDFCHKMFARVLNDFRIIDGSTGKTRFEFGNCAENRAQKICDVVKDAVGGED